MARTIPLTIVAAGDDAGAKPPVTLDGTLDLPESSDSHDAAVLLLHGAGGDLHGGHLDGTAAAFANAHLHPLPVVRVTMRSPSEPYRLRCARGALASAKRHPALAGVSRWILAGHSNGARVAARLAAELRAHPERGDRVLACALFSYPLHPPGKRDALRDAEILALPPECPLFFCVGEGDPFAEQRRLRAFLDRVRARGTRVVEHLVERGGHSLGAAKKGEAAVEALRAARDAAVAFAEEAAVAAAAEADSDDGRFESKAEAKAKGGKRRARKVEGEDGRRGKTRARRRGI
jgi:predicted alpha/beta-hydrolase family hydrolase